MLFSNEWSSRLAMAPLVGKRRRTLKRKSGWFILAMISVLTKGTVKVPESPSCAVLTPVETGSQSAVRCHFSSPLAKGDDFSVELHQTIQMAERGPGTKSRVSSVLNCYNDLELRCKAGEGYTWSYENNPDLTVQVNITKATARQAGRYVCKKTPDPLGSHKGCVLNVKEKGQSNQRTNCKVSEPVTEGGPSAISCHFKEDPSRHKHYFNVLRYDDDKANPMPELVLACHWPNGGRWPTCDAAEGYTFDTRTVSNAINLFIINTTTSQEGRYVCEDALSLTYNMKECKLTVTGRDLETAERKQFDAWTIALAVMVVVVTTALLFILFWRRSWIKNTPCCNGKGPRATQCEDG